MLFRTNRNAPSTAAAAGYPPEIDAVAQKAYERRSWYQRGPVVGAVAATLGTVLIAAGGVAYAVGSSQKDDAPYGQSQADSQKVQTVEQMPSLAAPVGYFSPANAPVNNELPSAGAVAPPEVDNTDPDPRIGAATGYGPITGAGTETDSIPVDVIAAGIGNEDNTSEVGASDPAVSNAETGDEIAQIEDAAGAAGEGVYPVPATPEPEKEKYKPTGQYIESGDGMIVIEYQSNVGNDVMRQDLTHIRGIMDNLTDLFGAYPTEQIIFEKDDNGRVKIKPIGKYYPGSMVWNLGSNRSTDGNEIVDVFIQTLLPTDQLWYREGLSNFSAGYVELNAPENYDFTLSKWDEDYDNVVSGDLKLEGEWLDAHKGSMLFAAAAKYFGLTEEGMKRINLELQEKAKDENASFQDIKDAFVNELGEEILEAFEVLDPIFRHNAHGSPEEKLGAILYLHPELNTPAYTQTYREQMAA